MSHPLCWNGPEVGYRLFVKSVKFVKSLLLYDAADAYTLFHHLDFVHMVISHPNGERINHPVLHKLGVKKRNGENTFRQ